MSRSLTSALLASLGIHAGFIASIPTGQGWHAADKPATAALHASLRLPALADKSDVSDAPMAHRRSANPAPESSATAAEDAEDLAETAPASTFGLPIPDSPRQYESTELTDRPAPLDALPPDLEAALPGSSGRAILQLEIDEKGIVVGITPETSEIDSASLAIVTAAFKEMRFLPGRIGKTPVRTRMRIEITIDDWRREIGDQKR